MVASGEAAEAASPPSVTDTVFLGWTTSDLSEEREKLRRELEARNYRVVPSGAPPLDAKRLRETLLDTLRDAKVAIHLIGAHYGFVPEGDERSIIELQSDEVNFQASNSAAVRSSATTSSRTVLSTLAPASFRTWRTNCGSPFGFRYEGLVAKLVTLVKVAAAVVQVL